MESQTQRSSNTEDKNNINLKKDNEYTLISHFTNEDEEQQLLKSLNQPIQDKDNISRASSKCDQSIELIASNLIESKEIYQHNQKNIQEQQQKSQNKFDSSEILDTVKDFVNSFVDLFKWKREYDSFKQLYFQLGFDGLLAFYFYKKQKKLNNQREQSKKDEKLMIEMDKALKNNGLTLFHTSKLGENTLIFQETSYDDNIDKNQVNQLKVLFLKGQYLEFEIDKDFQKVEKGLPFKSNMNMGFLTKITASTISLLSGNLFKSKISLGKEKSGEQFTYYLFGKKALLHNSQIGMQLKQKILQLDLKLFKYDQMAYLISILVASGIGLYFSIKIVKNLIYLAKKKKLFRKRK